jgi:hypothetical protein
VELDAMARDAMTRHGVRYGLVLQGARYEGLVCGFVEYLGAMGGTILDEDGGVALGDPARRALTALRDQLRAGIVPAAALGWHEEEARFAFARGDAVFMRNWPYAYPLVQDPRESRVAGKVAVAPMPAGHGGEPTAALGGAQLGINARTRHPDAAWALVAYLTAPDQAVERARAAGLYPPRLALYRSGVLDGILPIAPADALAIVERAVARPSTPMYAELSAALQVHLHRALAGQIGIDAAIADATHDVARVLAATGPVEEAGGVTRVALALVAVVVVLGLGLVAWRAVRRRPVDALPGEEHTGWLLVAPAVVALAAIALIPLAREVDALVALALAAALASAVIAYEAVRYRDSRQRIRAEHA